MDHPPHLTVEAPKPLRVLSWNARGIRGIGRRLDALLDAIARDGADVVALQEVSARSRTWARLRDGLARHGWSNVLFSGDPAADRKRYGNVLASRHALRSTQRQWAVGQPWPQLVNAAVVAAPGLGDVEVIAVHMPNGSGNGWRKIDAFEALERNLARPAMTPVILVGDFNEPAFFDAAGVPISFGQTVGAAHPTRDGDLTRRGETGPRTRWDDAVRDVLGGSRLARAQARLGMRVEPTHLTRGAARCFDHVLAARELEPLAAGYHHAWREDGLSDHSAVWAAFGRAPGAGVRRG